LLEQKCVLLCATCHIEHHHFHPIEGAY
jgi:hypothetical protein